MEKSQIVLWLFVPADQQTTKAIHPRMCPFNHPSACFEPCLLLDRFGFFSTLANVSRKAEFAKGLAYLLIVIAFVQTHALRQLLSWFWTPGGNALKGRACQLHISAVGSLNHQSDRHSVPFCEQTAFHPAFAAIGGIGTGFFPTQRCLCHGSIHRDPVPFDSSKLFKFLESCLPQLEENP